MQISIYYKNKPLTLLCIFFLFFTPKLWSQGYYKDLLINGGNFLSCAGQDEAQTLGLSYEYWCDWDGQLQSDFFGGDFRDSNGALLYPDGEPRYRLIYTNGGYGDHGGSLSYQARNAVTRYFQNGGSYTGSCNGAFLSACAGSSFNLFCHTLRPTGLGSQGVSHQTTLKVPVNSPLRNYYTFGSEVTNVLHSGGYYLEDQFGIPANAEVLLQYKGGNETWPNVASWWHLENRPAAWAYKIGSSSGRVAVCGSHPEGGGPNRPETKKLQMAMFQYAMDGNGDSRLKKALSNGVEWIVDQDANLYYTNYSKIKIGDKQYHHFSLQVPAGQPRLTVELDGTQGYDFNLYARQGSDFVFDTNATHLATQAQQSGSDQILCIDNPQAGTWYFSVECATTVNSDNQRYGYPEYTGPTAVLNGLDYSIKATWGNVQLLSIGNLGGPYTTSDPAVTLFGSPAGGVFSGPGVNNGQFFPSVAGPGTHSIVYSLGCEQTSRQVVVSDQCAGQAPNLIYPEIISIAPGNPYTITAGLSDPNILSYTWTTSHPSLQIVKVLNSNGLQYGVKVAYSCNASTPPEGTPVTITCTANYCQGNSYSSSVSYRLFGCGSSSKMAAAAPSVEFRIGPNPASSFLKVYSEEGGSLSLYNLQGRKAATYSIPEFIDKQVEISGLGSGVYFYEMKSHEGKKIQSGKLIINVDR